MLARIRPAPIDLRQLYDRDLASGNYLYREETAAQKSHPDQRAALRGEYLHTTLATVPEYPATVVAGLYCPAVGKNRGSPAHNG